MAGQLHNRLGRGVLTAYSCPASLQPLVTCSLQPTSLTMAAARLSSGNSVRVDKAGERGPGLGQLFGQELVAACASLATSH